MTSPPGTSPPGTSPRLAGRRQTGSEPRWGTLRDCVALAVGAALLRWLWLGAASLWIDELFSVSWSGLSPRYLLGQGAHLETNPPGYYLLLRQWMAAFGTSEVALRSLSALASVATVPVVYALGRSLFDRQAGWLAGALMLINPVGITYAQQARSYALMTLADALALLALSGAFRQPPTGGRDRLVYKGLFIASAVLTGWMHYTSLLFIAGCGVAIALLLLRERQVPWRQFGIWCVAGLIVLAGVGWLVWLAAHLTQSDNLIWVPPLSAESVMEFSLDLLVPAARTPEMMPLRLGVAGLLILVASSAAWRARLPPPASAILLVIPGVYCALLIGASAVRPMLLARTASWLVVPLCVLLARGILAWPARWRPAVAAMPVLAFAACTTQLYLFPYIEDWRGAARLIATDSRCQGPVLIGDFNALGFHYYSLPAGRPTYVFLPDPRRRNAVEFHLTQQLMHLPELSNDTLQSFITSHPGAALAYRWEYDDAIAADLPALLPRAAPQQLLGGTLRLVCFP